MTGTGTYKLVLPSGVTVEEIEVTALPGAPGSASPQTETVIWSQKLNSPRKRFGRKQWNVNVSWTVTVPHELKYVAS
jgi:hypothetical protein